MIHRCCICLLLLGLIRGNVDGHPHRILLDTDVDTDDLFALLYLLKLDRSVFDLQAVTVNANAWSNAGHAVNHVYDLLHMMGRDDIAVGVGGEGGILKDGTILPNVGGYLPIIEQGNGTAGYCRYRQAISAGRILVIDTNFGLRKIFLPQGRRRYSPLRQPTVQQVMTDKISAGPITVFTIGANTNLAIFLMSNPHLKKNIQHVYIMGGGVRSENPTACSPRNSRLFQLQQCGYRGNIFNSNPSNTYAESNMFGDPFAAYQVIHSGIPVTLVPLDATNTIPVTSNFFEEFEKNQNTYEAQYCFQSLKMARDTWANDQFFKGYFMWDSFLSGVATSIMLKENNTNGDNEFAEMEYMNITVITSNEPYGIHDGSNPFFDGLKKPKFGLKTNGVHSGHVQTGLKDPFCVAKNENETCKDAYTAEVTGREGVRVLVAVKAKPNREKNSSLDREYFRSFLDVLNRPQQTGNIDFRSQFPRYKEVAYKPDFHGRKLGKNVVFDMDMSAGDFLALFYLLKVPVEVINLKAILVTPTGWANAATIDVVYDLLHMMGRDDIPVGLGDLYALNQSSPFNSNVGDCKYKRVIPHGSGGFLDSDTLYGLARDLPHSPRRYTAENSVEFGAPRDTDHPELRQPLAHEIWQSVVKSLGLGTKVTILTNGPLTNVAHIILSDKNLSSPIQEIVIVGGDVTNTPSDEYAEMNMFLDPLAAKTVFDSSYNITLIPLNVQRKVSGFSGFLKSLHCTEKTPEALFAMRLLSRLRRLKRSHPRYQHVDMFAGEILGAVILASSESCLKTRYGVRKIRVEGEDGRITVDRKRGRLVNVLEDVDPQAYYMTFAKQLGASNQSAIIGSFEEQRKRWSATGK